MDGAAPCERPGGRASGPLTADGLVSRYLSSVLRFAAMLSPPETDPEDVAQEAMITALARLPSYDPGRGTVDAWLWRIVLSRAQDAGRAARRRALLFERLRSVGRRSVSDGVSPEAVAMAHLDDERLLAAVHRLPRRYRTVIALRFGAQLSGPETAAMLGVSRMAVVKTTARALDRLRKDLEEVSE